MRHVSAVSGIVFTSITHFFKDKLVLYTCLYARLFTCVFVRVFLHLDSDTENFFLMRKPCVKLSLVILA